MQERILLYAKKRQQDLEQMRISLIIKTILLDKTNQESINGYNDFLDTYWSILIPEHKVTKQKTYEDKAKMLEDFTKDFRSKFKIDKIKNFEKAN